MKKQHSLGFSFAVGLVAVSAAVLTGCSRETQLVPTFTPPPLVAVAPVAVPVPAAVPVAPLPPGATPAVAAAPAPVSLTPQVHDFEDRSRLRDYSEKVYLRWNEALGDFRKERRRLPATLDELKQFRPKLAELAPPPGYELQFDAAGAEINVLPASTAKLSARNP